MESAKRPPPASYSERSGRSKAHEAADEDEIDCDILLSPIPKENYLLFRFRGRFYDDSPPMNFGSSADNRFYRFNESPAVSI